MKRSFVFLILFVLVGFFATNVRAQSLDVTFRYVPQPEDNFVRVFTPGEFNGWGPNSAGVISTTAPSLMTYDATLDEYLYTIPLLVGSDYQYKFHYHFNASGSNWQWISDPNNPVTDPANNNNSIVSISDPMVFELARQRNATGNIVAVSAGIFGTNSIAVLDVLINDEPLDGLAHFDTTTGIFKYQLANPVPAGSKLVVQVTDSEGGTAADSVGIIPPSVVDMQRPDGLEDGITYGPDPTKATLSLFAPYKNYVHVLGDFNNWTVDEDYLMLRDSLSADSMWFWMELDNLTPGVEYAFQYQIDGQIRVADPYSEKILDQSNDGFLGDVYPGLKPYPAGKTSHPVTVLQTNKPAYNWSITDFDRPHQKDLVIYELLLRDFIEDHSFDTLVDTLDYLETLGVNAIELMPVSEFDGNLSWGYNPAFHMALDKYYGPGDTFKAFVDACHARGIAVILDVVYNHATGSSPLIRMYNDSPVGDPSALPTAASPYANRTAKHPFNVFNDLDHESSATRYWLDRVNKYWLTEYKIDGYRFDLSKGFTQRNSGSDVGLWGQYDATRVANIKRMANEIWSIDSTAYLIMEHFGSATEEQELAEYRTGEGFAGMMFWDKATTRYNEATMGYNSGSNSDFSVHYYKNRGWQDPNLVTYMESHDEQWLMYKNVAFGACSNFPAGGNGCDSSPGEYSTRDFPTAFDRMKMAGAFFFTLPGPKMIWQFGELGYGYGPDGRECLEGTGFSCPAGTPGRTGAKPIRWEYREDPLRFKLYQVWSSLINLRREHEVFTSTDTQVTFATAGNVKRLKLEHADMSVVVIGNFGVSDQSAAPEFPAEGMWYNFFVGDSISVTGTGEQMVFAPGEFHLYTNSKVSNPPPGLITVDREIESPAQLATALGEAYPNPANKNASVPFSLAATSSVQIELFDLLGRSIKTVYIGELAAGEHVIPISGSGLAPGLYFYRLNALGRTFSRSIVFSR